MELIKTMAQFMAVVNSNYNVLYGAGKIGRYIYTFLRDKNIPVTAFAVTHLEREEKVEGVPVYCLDDIQKDNINLILTADETHCVQMEAELEKRGIHSYYRFSRTMRYEFIRERVNLDAKRCMTLQRERRDAVPVIGFLSTKYFGVGYSNTRLIIDRIEEAVYYELPWEMPEMAYIGAESEEGLESYKKQLVACYFP